MMKSKSRPKSSKRTQSRKASHRIKLPDPRLQRVAERTAKLVELAMEKVVAHRADPTKYPLPPGEHTLERIFKRLFDRIGPERRKRATNNLAPLFRATAKKRREIYGDLTRVDLRLPVSVVDQFKKLSTPKELQLSEKLKADIEKKLADLLNPDPVPAQAAVAVAVESRLLRVRCVKETALEPGADEMVIGGTAVDNLGNITAAPTIDLGQFRSGDEVEFPLPDGQQFFQYDLSQGEFPKAFFTAFILVELDAANASNVLIAISQALLAVGGAITVAGASSGSYPLIFVGLMTEILSLIVLFVGFVLLDEVFNQVFIFPVVLASDAAVFANGLDTTDPVTVRYTQHGGEYQFDVDYRLLTQT